MVPTGVHEGVFQRTVRATGYSPCRQRKPALLSAILAVLRGRRRTGSPLEGPDEAHDSPRMTAGPTLTRVVYIPLPRGRKRGQARRYASHVQGSVVALRVTAARVWKTDRVDVPKENGTTTEGAAAGSSGIGIGTTPNSCERGRLYVKTGANTR